MLLEITLNAGSVVLEGLVASCRVMPPSRAVHGLDMRCVLAHFMMRLYIVIVCK